MDTLKIDTAQNIDIEQPIASIGERIAATTIDLIFITIYLIAVSFIGGMLRSKAFLFISFIPVALYSLVSELAMNGQSWGKQAMNIKVVKIDGTPVSFSSYFLRWITRILEVFGTFGTLGTITIILNRKGQRLGDMAANTTVIRVSKKNLKELSLIKIPDNYQVVFPEASQLSIEDINTIREVLQITKTVNEVENTKLLATKTRQAIEQKLSIQSEMKIVPFFQTILRDYTFIQSQS